MRDSSKGMIHYLLAFVFLLGAVSAGRWLLSPRPAETGALRVWLAVLQLIVCAVIFIAHASAILRRGRSGKDDEPGRRPPTGEA